MAENLGKWKFGLQRTRQKVFGKLANILAGKRSVDEALLDKIEEVLIEADFGVDTTLKLIEAFKEVVRGNMSWSEETVYFFLKKRIVEMVSFEKEQMNQYVIEKPHVIVVVGVNGTGKTTTIGKLAYRFSKDGLKVLLACADTFRAGAGEQLSVWADRVSADIVQQKRGGDAASVAFDALDAAQSRRTDVLIVDTAGRFHTKMNLMEELKKICRVLKRKMETAPHEVLFVLDATTGQNGMNQVKLFHEAVGVTGIVLTKLDGTAKGGMVISIHQKLGIPVKWVGIGEGREDLLEFNAESFVEGLFE
ncbi:signal recognition particle-docking protein FtsY [bacterium]|nr:signal recognition particle-docking protein FtsY [bacterium]